MDDINVSRTRFVGINRIALEVSDLDAALEFYAELFEFKVRGRIDSGVFLDIGDQFLAMMETMSANSLDDYRHFGLVTDNPGLVEQRLEAVDVEPPTTGGLAFYDP